MSSWVRDIRSHAVALGKRRDGNQSERKCGNRTSYAATGYLTRGKARSAVVE